MKRTTYFLAISLLSCMSALHTHAQRFDEWKADLCQQWKDSVRTAMKEAYDSRTVTLDSLTMRLHWQVFGEKPADGRSLYISLHGGGGAPPELNDSQWRNQWRLYTPDEGVYLCPRPPFNTWDLHFRPECDRLYEEVIHMMVAFLDVNPDKVYVMGYSAGGDGVWRLAPRMADHWAAASMMAGHPGDVSLLNLRNLPFMVWCGEQDAAYNRNNECKTRIIQLDSLHHDDLDGYIHEGHIVAGKGHWMDRTDTLAIEWMAQHRRNPYPDRVIWQQADVPKQHFYFLSCPAEEMQKGKTVRIHRNGNDFFIDKCDYSSITIGLDPQHINLHKHINIFYQGKRIFHAKAKPSINTMQHTLNQRQDFAFTYPTVITVNL